MLNWKLDNPQRRRPIHDTAAWLVRAIEENYTLPSALQTQPIASRKIVMDIDEQEGVVRIVEEPVGADENM